MSLYEVGNGTGSKSDVNQLVDALSGQNDVGAIQAFSQIAPPGALTAAVNPTSGNLSGTYKYAVAFLTGYWQGPTETGTLHTQGNTGGGTVSNSVTPTGQQVNLSSLPIGGTGVVGRAIYRTKANGSTFYFLQQINDNVSTTWTDNMTDAALGTAMPTTNTTGSYFSGDGRGLTNLTIGVNSVNDTNIGNRIADPTQAPSGLTGTLTQWVSWIANRIKAITGTTNWYDAPPTTLTAAEAHMTNTNNPHSVTATQVGAIPQTAEGQAGGVATLDNNSLVVQKAKSAVSADTVAWSGVTGTPTTLSGYGVTAVPWGDMTGTPTTLSGYGVDSVPWGDVVGAPTMLAGYGIVDAVNKTGDTMTGALGMVEGSTLAGRDSVPNYDQYMSSPDSYGIYTVLQLKRPNGTLYMKSTLSNPDVNGNYQTDTWQFYDSTGANVVNTHVWSITWDSNNKATQKVMMS